MTDSLIGQMVGPADVRQFLGEGGVGVVYLGRHRSLGLDVAVKLLKDGVARGDPSYRERFHREAQLAARLNHPGIVRVLDFGEHGRKPYMIMEYVDGYSLEAWLERRPPPVPENTGLKILVAVAAGLAAAHAEGIAHRDLKPANLLITRKGHLKIADLGLARERGSAGLTQASVAVGTPSYMAPETLDQHASPDHRVDLYALGVIGYQLAFGRLPYVGSVSEVVRGHMGGGARFDLPTAWSKRAVAAIRTLMAHDPARRPADGAAAMVLLRGILDGTGRIAKNGEQPPAGRDPETTDLARLMDGLGGESTSEIDGRRIVHTTGRERKLVWLILVAVIAVALTGYLGTTGGRSAASGQIAAQPASMPPAPVPAPAVDASP